MGEWNNKVDRAVTSWPPHLVHKFSQIDLCRYVQSCGESLLAV